MSSSTSNMSSSNLEDSMTLSSGDGIGNSSQSWVDFSLSGSSNAFLSQQSQSQSHHRPQHHAAASAAAAATVVSSDDDTSTMGDSVTSSIMSQSFCGSFHRRMSMGSTTNGGKFNRRASLELFTPPQEEEEQSPKTIVRKKRVRFHPKVEVQVTLPRSSYTESEIARTWHSKTEGEKMKKDILVTVQAMRKFHERRIPADKVDAELAVFFSSGGRVPADKTTTDRGLEHMRTARSVENRKRHKERVVNTVLDEQDATWDEGMEPGSEEAAMRIAEASCVATKPARQDAARKGKKDARFVEQCRRDAPARSTQPTQQQQANGRRQEMKLEQYSPRPQQAQAQQLPRSVM